MIVVVLDCVLIAEVVVFDVGVVLGLSVLVIKDADIVAVELFIVLFDVTADVVDVD